MRGRIPQGCKIPAPAAERFFLPGHNHHGVLAPWFVVILVKIGSLFSRMRLLLPVSVSVFLAGLLCCGHTYNVRLFCRRRYAPKATR
ncbi:hypothetical protein [Candidatus Spongiihabitans sp.]|uniref:hypothetical protein n=1 Tax=Candidatus Spongiihabitans sp. TaxID=3101308 RepID=UPI003C7D5918